jgi:hypothetical protein
VVVIPQKRSLWDHYHAFVLTWVRRYNPYCKGGEFPVGESEKANFMRLAPVW